MSLDLARRHHEVRLLFFKFCARKVAVMGLDPEDCLQAIYLGLITRQNGKSRFDSSKSSWGHYVHMVCESVTSNFLRHNLNTKRGKGEQIGVVGLNDAGEASSMDAASSQIPDTRTPAYWLESQEGIDRITAASGMSADELELLFSPASGEDFPARSRKRARVRSRVTAALVET